MLRSIGNQARAACGRRPESWMRSSKAIRVLISFLVKRLLSQRSCARIACFARTSGRRPPASDKASCGGRSSGEGPRRRKWRRLQAVDDGHRRRPVHVQALGEVGLGDAGMVVDQPQHRDLLLGQVELGEGLGEMAIDRDIGQPDVEARRCRLISPISLRSTGSTSRFKLWLGQLPSPLTIILLDRS